MPNPARGAAILTIAAVMASQIAMPATSGEPAPAQQQSVAAGERAFQKCYACHSVDGTGADTDGPSLKGVFGRKVAGLPGYRYSPALRAYAGRQARWTRDALDQFLADPQAVVPENFMGFYGIQNGEERAALIAYLAAH
ncbi:MAG: c-type cytochrome [Erythrobacter sp.]